MLEKSLIRSSHIPRTDLQISSIVQFEIPHQNKSLYVSWREVNLISLSRVCCEPYWNVVLQKIGISMCLDAL